MPESSEVEAYSADVEVSEELTQDEEQERHRLELRVERAFYEAGAALRELRDKRLYRSTHRTFEKYCQNRFGYTRRRPYQLIEAAIVFENLCTNGTQINDATNELYIVGTQNNLLPVRKDILPTSERQVRDLINLEPNEQREVWRQAVEQAGNKVPNGRIVKGIVEQLKEKPLTSSADFCQIGDVFVLTKLERTELQYNGCPCVAVELNNFTVNVEVHDTILTVEPKNLKPIDEPQSRRQLPQTLKRLKRLRNAGLLDRGAYYVLEALGRQTYLTDFEADLLTFVEQRYGVED